MTKDNYLILIDANVYLDFYASGGTTAKLKSLIDGYIDRIFISQQVAIEILRNRSKLVSQLFQNYSDQLNQELPRSLPEIPIRLLADKQADAKAWNDSARKVKDAHKQLKEQFIELRSWAIESVRTGEDELSQLISKVTSRAVAADDQTIQKARRRKELGNPPGKRNDPLGDQITWELFLEKCSQVNPSTSFLLARDNDYFVPHVKKSPRFLNPLLEQEFTRRCPKTQLICHDNLEDMLESLRKYSGSTLREPLEVATEPEPDIIIPPLTGVNPYDFAVSGTPPLSASALMDSAPKYCKCGGGLFGQVGVDGGRLSWDLRCHKCGATMTRL
jgi:hypothetical protein